MCCYHFTSNLDPTSTVHLLRSRILFYHACLLLDNMSTCHAQVAAVTEKKGGQTDGQTHTHTHTHAMTLAAHARRRGFKSTAKCNTRQRQNSNNSALLHSNSHSVLEPTVVIEPPKTPSSKLGRVNKKRSEQGKSYIDLHRCDFLCFQDTQSKRPGRGRGKIVLISIITACAFSAAIKMAD